MPTQPAVRLISDQVLSPEISILICVSFFSAFYAQIGHFLSQKRRGEERGSLMYNLYVQWVGGGYGV